MSTMPATPSTSGSRKFPVSAKQCVVNVCVGGIFAPKPYTGYLTAAAGTCWLQGKES